MEKEKKETTKSLLSESTTVTMTLSTSSINSISPVFLTVF